MRRSIVILIAAVLLIAAAAAVWSLSAPVLDEDAEYTLTSLYCRGQEVSDQVDEDELLELLEDASRSLLPRGGLPRHTYTEMIEVNLHQEEGPWRIVLCTADGVYAAYADADWCYTIRDGETLAQAVQALLPE